MKVLMIAALAVVAVISLAAPSTARAHIVFDGRWAAPGLNHWDTVLFMKPGNDNRLRYVESPRRRASGYSPDLLVGGNAASERIIFLKNVFLDAEGKDDWWAWSVYIPADFAIPNSVFVVSLFSKFNWPTCGLRGPANSLYMVNPDSSRPADRWRYVLAGGKGGACNVRYVEIPGLPVVKQKWIDFSCHYRWSSAEAGTPGTGISKCWYRVEPNSAWTLGFDDVGPNLISTAESPGSITVHYGLYKAEEAPFAHLDLGGLIVADTRQEAEQRAFGSRTGASLHRSPSARPGAAVYVAGGVIAVLALAIISGNLRSPRRRRSGHHGRAS
jgi:Polysaccharide lyase